jgi:hypothetical protein
LRNIDQAVFTNKAKILYKTQVVFPANQQHEEALNSKASFAISSGQYEYPFSFKIPLNNACQQTNSLATNSTIPSTISGP